jgi:hypothetical protein
MFATRDLLISTKHQKEVVIAPVLEKALGVKCLVAKNLDTDQLGTFTGEVERRDDPIVTLRKKCLWAMEMANIDLAVASEGSFGPHPSVYLVPADDEFLIFMDKANGIEIIVRELSTETNFNQAVIFTHKDLNEFASHANFPSHGLILRNASNDYKHIEKGITDADQLRSIFDDIVSRYGSAFIETDMRAMYNPTRMKVIENAAKKLAEKINTVCPACNMPGFGITDAKQGLPCLICHFPTRSILSYVSVCKKCAYTKEKIYPHGKLNEDPMYCDVCNP